MAEPARGVRRARLIMVLLCLVSLCGGQAGAPSPADPDRTKAFELYKQGKYIDAMPLFEKLSADHPKDSALREAWAWCLLGYSYTLPRGAERVKLRARAHSVAIEASRLGDKSQLLEVMLADLPEDGSEPAYSANSEVDGIMRTAEADFARGDLEKARAGYLHALLLDPKNYVAALFIGDSYYRQQRTLDAGEWFSRAIAIDPNQEAAHRYWGDTLMAAGDQAAARAKYIDAMVAEPYNRKVRGGLVNWLQRNNLQLNFVQLTDRVSIAFDEKQNGKLTLDQTLPADDPNGKAWLAYGLARAAFHTQALQDKFPNVPRNRRTLPEEAYSLEAMVTAIKKDPQDVGRLDPALRSLVKIEEAGFLEPFVLLNRADAGIAQDYDLYRTAHRDLFRRYLDEFVVPNLPPAQR